ncbi:hypothetical protein Syun_005475 [Stephania yunnanensis]|uniref:PCI domain-containing protein n=1 Tax=Stephania yunnanensis TaxID=152371 RepID=A0AAP0Q2A3_9MAGN
MTQDVEMKEVAAPSNSTSSAVPSTLQRNSGFDRDWCVRQGGSRIVRAVRLTIALRRKLKASVVSAFLGYALAAGSEAHSRLVSYLPRVSSGEMEDEHDMEVDTASSVAQSPVKHSLPELEIYCYLLVLIFLIDQKKFSEAKACSSASIARLRTLNRRTVDVLASRLYFYYSYSYEMTGDLAEIRGTIQLEYTDAKESLLQAARKAPAAARGFRVQCNKWAIIVRLLLGEIPERTVFMQKGMKKALVPYFELTNENSLTVDGIQAVRVGDLELFRVVAEKFASTFSSDGTHNLIVRLRHNVIRTGLRNISISYSRISLADVAQKLRLDSENPVADAESIVSKAIRDGAIDATIDHANGWMVSKETGDVYSTNEPQFAFNSRIAFCLNMHNEAVRALRFPPNSHKKEKESAEKRRERQQQEQELAKHIAEEDDDEF